MAQDDSTIRVGIVGTGFISKHFLLAFHDDPGLDITRVLTRRDPDRCGEYPDRDLLTNSRAELMDNSDVIFECTGDPLYASDVIDEACKASRPVVTLNAEFHVTAGSYFVDKGLVSEAEGDQPGSQAALHERAVEMGFRPIVYGNTKSFLNHTPTLEEMEYWGAKQNISLPMVTSFTDGTKLQIEQALVANGLGATVAAPGLLGPQIPDLDAAAQHLAAEAKKLGTPIADYVLFAGAPHAIFVAAEHNEDQRDCLAYLKMGDGPFYVMVRKDILAHLEVARTIRRVAIEGRSLLTNSALPSVNVVTVAKRDLPAGTRIDKGIGSFDVRGIAVKIADSPGALPIGLMDNAVITRPVEAGAHLTFDDVDLPDSLALEAWRQVEKNVVASLK